ncbi:MAG: deoxyhypusine synthase family protein [Deltaproteobacteria bacterium]|nr:deoxyhypusine synthase family protein [Deltaproteobacteria bacterium]
MKFKPLDLKKIRTYSVKKRRSKVSLSKKAAIYKGGCSFKEFLCTLPGILAASDLKAVVAAMARAHRDKRTIALGMGAHVIKTGLSPLIIELMERGIVNAVATNGACIIHDFELAYLGQTSEDVDKELRSGMFGMARETGELLNNAIGRGVKKGYGLGKAVGEFILNSKFPNKDVSIFAAAERLNVPITVHVALGTDIIHAHPSMNGSLTGEGSMRDFKIFSSVVQALSKGVFLNIGSAVLIPEVFLKALTLSRNIGGGEKAVKDFTTVDMDFVRHYRPMMNVVKRPTAGSGKGYALIGHHEIMLPLLFAALIEELA